MILHASPRLYAADSSVPAFASFHEGRTRRRDQHIPTTRLAGQRQRGYGTDAQRPARHFGGRQDANRRPGNGPGRARRPRWLPRQEDHASPALRARFSAVPSNSRRSVYAASWQRPARTRRLHGLLLRDSGSFGARNPHSLCTETQRQSLARGACCSFDLTSSLPAPPIPTPIPGTHIQSPLA